MSEPTPLSNAASDLADLVERYRDDALAVDERERLAQRLAADPVFRDEFRAHLRLAQTLAAELDQDPDASARRADLALAALSSSRRLTVWRAVTTQIDADADRGRHWWRWAAVGAAAALLLVATLPWMVRDRGPHHASPVVEALAAQPSPEAHPANPEPIAQRPAQPSPATDPKPVTVAHAEPLPAAPVIIHGTPTVVTVPASPEVAPAPVVASAVVASKPAPAPAPRSTPPAPVTTVVASARGVAGQERVELPEHGAWVAGGASVRRGARELPAHGLLALVPGDDIEIGDRETTVQPDDGIRLVCAAHTRLVASPVTGRRQVGRYVALVSGALTSAEVAGGETLIVATDHGEVVAAGARLELSLHDGWLRCAVNEGSARIGPQHRRIDAGATAVLAGGRVLTVYAPGRTGAAVLGGGWTRRGLPWFPLIAQTKVRTPAALAALAGNGFDAVMLGSANDIHVAAQAGLGIILELNPTILAQASMLHTQPELLAWMAPHDGSPRKQQEALRTVTALHRIDGGHAVLSRAGDGDTGQRLAAAVDGLVTSNPGLFTTHAPLARLMVSADVTVLRQRAYLALTEGARGLLVVEPQTQPEAVRALLGEITRLAPALASWNRDDVTAPAEASAARWSDGHDTVLIAVNTGEQAAAIPAVGGWTNGLHPWAAEGDDAPLVAGVLTVPAHGVCVLVTSEH